MKFLKILLVLSFSIVLFSCSKGGLKTIANGGVSSQGQPNPPPTPPPSTGQNTMSISIGQLNIPTVSVTVCVPGTSQCQTVSNVLLDTGSYGLRLFSSVLTLPLPAVTNSSGATYAECVSYAGGTSDWGPVAKADVKLGGEIAASVPIQLINSSFGKIPSNCQNPDTTPSEAGFNGIIGVGLFIQDCTAANQSGTIINPCSTDASNGLYYACSGSSCSGAAVPVASQVANPVAFLPTDNNGVVLQLPALPDGGANNVTGSIFFGIDTQANNTPTNFTVFPADGHANFQTTFNGKTYSAFIDSGSNGLFFPGSGVSSLKQCSQSQGFYCPTSTVSLTATQMGATGSASQAIPFKVINTDQASNSAYNDVGGEFDSDFDWGLPFFFGRNIYVGIQGRTASALGTGPYWAY